jgi:hypothetical protein
MVVTILVILTVGFEFAAGNGLRVVRPALDEAEWANEQNAIIKAYQDNEKNRPILKIVPLFIAVKLNLGEPIAEYGAVIREFAYIYSEAKNQKGEIVRSVTVLARSPYEDRRWSRFDSIIENEESMSNNLVLKSSVDVTGQITDYSKKLIGPLGVRDYIISVILFDEGASEVLGKKLDDEQIRRLFLR